MVYYSKNISWTTRNELTTYLEYKATTDLGKYLGIPILHSRVTQITYKYQLERINTKITKWIASKLLLAGRVTLAESVLLNLPIYPMQTTKIPKLSCQKIEKVTRQFVWNGTEDIKHIPLVHWKAVQNAKSNGGLRLRRLISY